MSWRVGRSTKRTIWFGENVLHGMVDTPAIAERICVAMNEHESLKARVAELESAIGIAVPTACRALLEMLPPEATIDRDFATAVLARLEKAMAKKPAADAPCSDSARGEGEEAMVSCDLAMCGRRCSTHGLPWYELRGGCALRSTGRDLSNCGSTPPASLDSARRPEME